MLEGQPIHFALEPEHHPERSILLERAGAPEQRHRFGEVGDVVDQPEAGDQWIDDPGRHEIEWAGAGREAQRRGRAADTGREAFAPEDVVAVALDPDDAPAESVEELELLEFQQQALPDLDPGRRQQAQRIVGRPSGEKGHITRAVEMQAGLFASLLAEQVGELLQLRVVPQQFRVPLVDLHEPQAEIASIESEAAGEVAGELG